ncbi:hypothetical protein MTO96_042255, partial [Rhipicephalus appendiculatus]
MKAFSLIAIALALVAHSSIAER